MAEIKYRGWKCILGNIYIRCWSRGKKRDVASISNLYRHLSRSFIGQTQNVEIQFRMVDKRR
jgi:hypothetical protein